MRSCLISLWSTQMVEEPHHCLSQSHECVQLCPFYGIYFCELWEIIAVRPAVRALHSYKGR